MTAPLTVIIAWKDHLLGTLLLKWNTVHIISMHNFHMKHAPRNITYYTGIRYVILSLKVVNFTVS